MKCWNPQMEVVVHNKEVVIANQMNGSWMKVSREIFDVINCLVQAEEQDRIEFVDKKDEEYMDSIMSFLKDTKALMGDEGINVPNKTVSIELTHKCNLRCVHCCVDADNTQKTKDLSTEEMKNLLYKCAVWNPKSIMLSGGEPLLRKDFKELLLYLRGIYQGRIIVSTNGTLLSTEYAKLLAEHTDQVDISLDGVDEETTSRVRGPGVFAKVMKAIERLHQEGFYHITLSMATADKNVYLEERFDTLCEGLQVKPMKRKFSAVGRGEQSKDLFSGKSEKEAYVPEEFKKEDNQKPFGVCSCSAGVRELFITHDGTVYPCPSFICQECAMENVTEAGSLEELVSRSGLNIKKHLMGKIEEFAKDRCKKCKVRLFCWTCPGQIEEIKTKEAFDDRCRQVKEVYYRRVWGDNSHELYNMDND